MKWKKFTIKTTTEAEDFISQMLSEAGIDGIEIEDKVPLTESETKGMFIDILPDLGPDNGEAMISFYLDDTYDVPATLEAVREGLKEVALFVNVGSCEIIESETEDKDWMNNWKQYFKPFVVDDLLIKPTWEEIPEGMEDKTMIEIDPGMAFGTGKHETTQLCIRGIRKYVKPGDRVLDVGTGSGILAICALISGASHTVGTDLDDVAIVAAHENAEVNGLTPDQYDIYIGNLIDDQEIKDKVGYEEYDVVVANILADVIIALQAEIAPHIKHGGIFITSGIIDMKEEAVKEAFAKNDELEVIDIVHQGEWVSVVARRK
ncbi:MAG: 50S ribosomal protein L11 methyltransferase [Lachnospiraceae bacterium]|nr:50S ribosomal protein L11 methyltransferase [Lachnospiraceae bacterium]